MARIRSESPRLAAEQTLVITRTFDAPRSLVFQAWTDPERVQRWFGPAGFTTPVCRIDLRPGGTTFNCMRSPEGQNFCSVGVIREVVAPERIVSTDSFADEHGNPVPPEHYGMSSDWPTEAVVTVTFTEHVGKTRLTLQHAPLKPGPERDMCRQGWIESLDKLADYLAQERLTQGTMKAVALDRFGGPELLTVKALPVPEVGPDEVLIHVEAAGVGQWDPFEREGGFAQLMGTEPKFPYILGSDGAGTVVAVGERVKQFRRGDRVYAMALANSKGGFYAEYAAVSANDVSLIPTNLSTEQAGAMPFDAITALRGLDEVLHVQPGESVMIFGASGGVGHLALQLAKRMGARVLAAASGDDGVALAGRLGADAVVDGHREDAAAAAWEFAPGGLDAALLTAGGAAAEKALTALRDGGRVAYPNGVEPEPQGRPDLIIQGYDGMPDPPTIEKLNHLIAAGPFEVHIARTFPLERAAEAHRALETHYLGKLLLRPA